MQMSRGELREIMELTPCKQDIREGDQFEHRPIKILQVQMCLFCVVGYVDNEKLMQEVNGRYCGAATNLMRAFATSVRDKWHSIDEPPACVCRLV